MPKKMKGGIFMKDNMGLNRIDYSITSNTEAFENQQIRDKEVEEIITSDNENEIDIVEESEIIEDESDNTLTNTQSNIPGSCLYNFLDDDELIIDDEIETEMETESETEKIIKQGSKIIVNNKDRITKPVLFKFERVRIIGDRTKQLSLGAKPMLLNVDKLEPKRIAELELEKGVLPFIIERPMPNGKYERWKVSELKVVN
jgi:DNA-directed RNA polymerase subunit K/omega